MSRYGGIPLSADRATFEAFEARVESAALGRYLDSREGPDPEECPRCDGNGAYRADEPCDLCDGQGWL